MSKLDVFIAFARSKIGIPWRHQGRSDVHGYDCVGILACAASDAGISDYDVPDYDPAPKDFSYVQHFRNAGMYQVDANTRRTGDIVLMREKEYPTHCAILTEKDGQECILDASRRRGIVFEEPFTPALRRSMTHVFRWPDEMIT